MAAAGAVVDAWFHGEWVLAPWSCFRVSLLEGKAACFGTSPWHVYLIRTPALMAPPLGIALSGLALAGHASPSVAGARAYERVWLGEVNLWADPKRARRLWRVHLDGGT